MCNLRAALLKFGNDLVIAATAAIAKTGKSTEE